MSLGGSSSSQRSSSQSEATSTSSGYNESQSYLSPEQLAAQQRLQGQFFNQMPQMGFMPGLEHNRGQVMQGLNRLGNQMGNYGEGLRATGQQGRHMLNQFAQQYNPYLNSQIHGLAQDFGQMFSEHILPGIGANAQHAGQRGSSRQGIAEALGAQRVAQEFGKAATGLRYQAYGQQQQAATDLANLGVQGSMQAYGLANQAEMGQGQMANMFANTGLRGQMMPFQIGSQVIGAPSVLSNSYGENMSESYATSTSSGKGSSAGLNIGFI